MRADSENPEVLVVVPHEFEAAAIVTALADYGIEALTVGGYTAGFRAEAPGAVKVLVKRADAEAARRALIEIREGLGEIDWSQVDVGESGDAE